MHLLPEAPVATMDDWLATGVGGVAVARAQQIGPAATIEELARSGLRGRGGGWFPTGRKWSSIAAMPGPRFLVCNAAEGEPGTFKDRALLRANPYQIVEGAIIGAFAIGAQAAYIATKASFTEERARLEQAVQELQAAGICADCELTVVAGPDEYLFGEETALLEVIEGRSPLPRVLPPYEHGLWGSASEVGWEGATTGGHWNPTVVNNAETLANVPHILARGAGWFRSMGTDDSPGTVVCTVVGDVVAPDVGELELGTTLRQAIDLVGSGVAPGRRVKAVLSGVSNPVLGAEALDVPLAHDALRAAGSGLGAAGFIVFDDTACMVEAARLISEFLYVESCGQCPPCKRGSGEITNLLAQIEGGAAGQQEVDELHAWLGKVTDGNRCYLAVEEQVCVSSFLRRFPDEFEEHLALERCPRPREVALPKLVDLRGGVARLDTRRKRPDWTYVTPPGSQPR